MDLPVELFANGQRRWVALEDISRSGMFLQTIEPLPVGTTVTIAIAPDGKRLTSYAVVTHRLDAESAKALGRHPGMGIAFRAPTDPIDHLFAIAVERLLRERRAIAAPVPGAHIIVADGDTRLCERLSSALSEAGFSVAIATTGMEVLASALRRAPDVVLVDRTLPVLDGFRVLEAMTHDPRLATIPVIVGSSVPSDIGPAFERGAVDFVARPYHVAEVIVRARRLAASSVQRAERTILRGTVAELPISALLTMLELERKTGRLAVTADHVSWLDLEDGVIVSAGTSRGDLPLDAVMTLLSTTHGTFELTSVAGPHGSELALPVRHALLEHAHRTDEAARRTGPIFARPPTPAILDAVA